MGKKVKVGKARKDKFYNLAKDIGYRSRAAFKLIQLNRKYGFLQNSNVLIDLCAAPGGWLQVAAQNMPVSPRVIIGVDLVPIRPIPTCITVEDDITKASCRQELKKQLQTWKADCVLNDGAPNVGKNWLHDAFQQAQLTLQALKLATDFLKKGGWFITKVFRSKDYNALLWVFKQFFKKVYATKPQASRNESAEIFVVCQNYIAPDRIDPKLLDTKYVFEEVDVEPKVKLNLMFPEKQKRRALGYADGETTCYHTVPVSKFIRSLNFTELLSDCSELVFDEDRFSNHPLTTDEIKECCKDIKVLGRKDLRLILAWRKKLRDELFEKKQEVVEEKQDLEEDEDLKLQRQVEELQKEHVQELKRKKKKVLKQRKMLVDKMNLQMVIPDEEPIAEEDTELFKINVIKNKDDLETLEKGDLTVLDAELALQEDEDEDENLKKRKKFAVYDKSEKNIEDMYSSDEESYYDDDEESLQMDEVEDYGVDEEETTEPENSANPLVTDLDNSAPEVKKRRNAEFWFGKEIFEGIENEADEDFEMDNICKYYDDKGALVKKNENINDEYNIEEEAHDVPVKSQKKKKEVKAKKMAAKAPVVQEIKEGSDDESSSSDEEETVTEKTGKRNKRKNLDIEGLALGSLMVQSKKMKRDLIDNAWNRFVFDDIDCAPNWFKEDEAKHNKKQIPVTKEMMEEFKERLKEINSRPIQKVAEAKARKKKKAMNKMAKARKRAEAITEAVDMTDKEKVQQIKTVYKKAGMIGKKKRNVEYVIAKRGRKVHKPAGPYKIVDPRMKKDNRVTKLREKESKKGRKGKRMPKGGKSRNNQQKNKQGR